MKILKTYDEFFDPLNETKKYFGYTYDEYSPANKNIIKSIVTDFKEMKPYKYYAFLLDNERYVYMYYDKVNSNKHEFFINRDDEEEKSIFVLSTKDVEDYIKAGNFAITTFQ